MSNNETNKNLDLRPLYRQEPLLKGLVKDSFKKHLVLKIGRLTGALFLFVEKESRHVPIIQSISSSACDLLDISFALIENNDRFDGLKRGTESSLYKKTSLMLIKVAHQVRLMAISEIMTKDNADILISEVLDLSQSISEKLDELNTESDQEIPKGLFDVGVEKKIDKGHSIGQEKRSILSDMVKESHKGHVGISKGQVSDENIESEEKNKDIDFSKNPRLRDILQALKKFDEMSVSEIQKSVGEVSKKTIQRDLTDLIEAGLVAKEGKKRWSRYKVTNNSR